MPPDLGPQSRCDLHLHTRRSDGALTPNDLIDAAIEGGLDVIALTDHDLTTNIPVGLHRRGDRQLWVIEGAELTGVHEGHEYHLLVYFPKTAPAAFQQFCQHQVQARSQRYSAAAEAIGREKVPTVEAYRQQGTESLTRHHLARALVTGGHATTLNEAFVTHVTRPRVPLMTTPYLDCIAMARDHGGVTSWAHPPIPALKAHVEAFAKAGLQGLEGLRPHLGATARKTLKKAAKRNGLFFTGGSDWHGWREPSLGLFFVPKRDLTPFFETLWESAA
jgi:predicted metal-dependent phosphoesterase TrpH